MKDTFFLGWMCVSIIIIHIVWLAKNKTRGSNEFLSGCLLSQLPMMLLPIDLRDIIDSV